MTEKDYILQLAKVRNQANEWDRKFKMRLNELYDVGGTQHGGGGMASEDARNRDLARLRQSPNWGLMTAAERKQATYYAGRSSQSGIAHDFGKAFSPEDFKMAKQAVGGNPYKPALKHLMSAKVDKAAVAANAKAAKNKAVGRATGSSGSAANQQEASDWLNRRKTRRQERENKKQQEKRDTELQQFFDEAQAKYEEANAANEERYAEIKTGREETLARNLERVANYGKASAADLEERAAETLGDIESRLQGRGLNNSTIFSAFEQRNARDLAREQQRLSERVDSRTADYDQRGSEELFRFMERRNDVQPDFNRLNTLAQQYGLSNDGQGFDGGREVAPAPAPVQQQAPQPVEAYAPQEEVSMGQMPRQNPFWSFGKASRSGARGVAGLTGGVGFNVTNYGGTTSGVGATGRSQKEYQAAMARRLPGKSAREIPSDRVLPGTSYTDPNKLYGGYA